MTKTATTLIAERLEQVQERIYRAAVGAGRDPAEITLVAISKTHGPEKIEAAYAAGLRQFGENRVEEASEKQPALARYEDIRWHMVGHIQSRKAKEVPRLFWCVHSVDRLKIAERLSRAAAEQGRTLDIFLEVNLSGEKSKYGFDLCHWPNDARQLASFLEAVEAVLALPNLRVNGLMTMPPYHPDPETTRPIYTGLATLRDSLQKRFPGTAWRHLSMGMTGDFEVAIQEGATMLRIGTAVFGPREYQARV